MRKTAAICLACCLGVVGARTLDEAPSPQRNAEAQKRRADLRAAVRARPDSAAPAPSGPGTGGARQLTQQERKELRQQLRQQRR